MLKVNGSGETPLDRCRGSEVEQFIRKIAACGGYSNAFVIPVHLSMLKQSGFSLPKHLYSDEILSWHHNIFDHAKEIPRVVLVSLA